MSGWACWDCGETWMPVGPGVWAPAGTGIEGVRCRHQTLHRVRIRQGEPLKAGPG